MSNKKAAIINGDGTGPELVDAMIKVLKSCNTNVELIKCDAGSEWWEKNKGNSYISEEVWETLKNSDACFKGPTTTVPNPNAPRSVAVSIRQKFQLYANIRPIKTYKISKLQLNFICVRESTEGLYAGIEFKTSDDSAVAIRKTTGKGCRRVVKKAFELAKQKEFKKIFAITKRNILKETDGIFWNAVTEINKEYPDIEVEEYYIDNMTQQLVKNPERFNDSLLLSTNLFMDIISECASGHVGSIGNVYSGNYGDNYAMFEPAHGSAPKHARQDKVNPTATILSGAWMVEYLGEKHISDAIFKATEQVIDEGKYLTYDLGGSASLSKMAEEIAQKSAALIKK
ncbi:isocitrate/isopropylmalate dehydrogenase family protein [Candidatus Nitrosocosmicus franklandus]|uniref:Isocitrate/isopropylmalate dehydrogenase n=1 Tax=Candidatus Nitrosocosmicus franklandianus TaxID=1798806 RepID=A0A484IG70_9ARCH|nr:isocitrate/isopropylmalate dehydrogenase family protein [Candidatus Nitrosocosmicus franklandus]VFJ14644.1 Isocitrate/isopropylmalate dehydrogenase [Candidatus Nitrosocosmicus franklandus]